MLRKACIDLTHADAQRYSRCYQCDKRFCTSTQFASGPFPLPPYYKARFSNGRVWIELVAATFGDELEDFATGNAISGATGEAPGQFMVQPPYANMSSAKEVFVPSTLEQVCVFPLRMLTIVALQGNFGSSHHALLCSACIRLAAKPP